MEQTIRSHLVELKQKSIILISICTIFFLFGYYYANILITYILKSYNLNINFLLFNPLDSIYLQMQTGFLFAFILGIPIITLFVLNYLEVKFKLIQTIIYSYIGIAILGSIGAYIGIVHIAPILLQYLINLRPFALYWNVLSTMSFIYLIGISFALILQLIIVIPLLHITQTIHTAKIKAYRKHYIVGILIISGIITPPDPLSLILIAIPLILSIELGLAISYMCPQMTAIHTGRKQEC